MAGKKIIDSKVLEKQKKRDSVTVLYPGAGSHIASLELGAYLSKKDSRIKKINYILTDIDVDLNEIFSDSVRSPARYFIMRSTCFIFKPFV